MVKAGAVLVLAVVLVSGLARAQSRPTLSGTWSASALTERWTIGDWGEACGPKPKPQGAGGGSVQIREQGNELAIVGAGRAFSTAQCWEQMPGLSRTSHSASGNGRFWRTRCTTAANDPRRAVVETTVSATDTTITLTETGQYQFVIQDTNCTASVTRSRSFSLVKRDGEETPAPSGAPSASVAPPPPEQTAAPAEPPKAPPPAPTAKSCDGPRGDPARLEVSPSRKVLRAGDRFTFRALVLDAEGCPIGERPAWRIAPGPLSDKLTLEPGGSVRVADDAGEGTVELGVSVAGKGVTVRVEIVSSARYEALLASETADSGVEDVAVAVIATGGVGGKTTVAEDTARARKHLFVAIVAGVAALLGLAGLVLARRGRRARDERERTSQHDIPEGAVAVDPDEALPPVLGEAAEPSPPRRPRAPKKKQGKICPTCGERYDASAAFCGKDGTTLVMLN